MVILAFLFYSMFFFFFFSFCMSCVFHLVNEERGPWSVIAENYGNLLTSRSVYVRTDQFMLFRMKESLPSPGLVIVDAYSVLHRLIS